MGIITYREEELMLFALYALDISAHYYAGVAYKFEVRQHYKEQALKGRGDDLNEFYNEDYESPEDILICNIRRTVNRIINTMAEIQKAYTVDFSHPEENVRVKVIAHNFHRDLIDDHFPKDTQQMAMLHEESVYPEYLLMYSTSLLKVIESIMEVLMTKQIDADEVRKRVDVPFHILKADYSDYEHAYTLGVLFTLVEYFNDHLCDIFDYYFGFTGGSDDEKV